MQTVLPQGSTFQVDGDDEAARYTTRLLSDLGALVTPGRPARGDSPARRCLDSGLACLTGHPEQPSPAYPLPLANYADGVLEAFKTLLGRALPTTLSGAELLTIRAAMTGLQSQGDVSPGGSCRILPSADGYLAVNLARDSDWRLLDAWLLADTAPTWPAVAAGVRQQTTRQLVEQGRLLGLAVTNAMVDAPRQVAWLEVSNRSSGNKARGERPRVVDLSSLWAGPLCSRLLQWAGAEVIKVESRQRPDGSRNGSMEFFEFLNHGKWQLKLDLHHKRGVQELAELIRSADIVIEGSRPRALRQMGIVAETFMAEKPGLTWVSISGYGRNEPQANWIAYGDDAGVAGGLSSLLHQNTGQWMICGDAIADPLTGMHAALGALASWQGGGGHLLAFSLVQTVQHCVAFSRH